MSILFNAYIHLPQIESQYNNNNNSPSPPTTTTNINTANTTNTNTNTNFYSDESIINPLDNSSSSLATQQNTNSDINSSKPQIQSTFELHHKKSIYILQYQLLFRIALDIMGK